MCDTNNHSVKTVNLETLEVNPLAISESFSMTEIEDNLSRPDSLGVDVSTLGGGSVELNVALKLPGDRMNRHMFFTP